jgi:hypothetical protein
MEVSGQLHTLIPIGQEAGVGFRTGLDPAAKEKKRTAPDRDRTQLVQPVA